MRHGETEWSATGRHTSHTDVPLTDAGRALAGDAGRVLAGLRGNEPFALELTSPRRRAVDTAALAGLAPAVDERLVEWDYGEYEGRTTPEIREDVPGWTVWTHPMPGGETAEQVAARADDVLATARAANGDVILVGHGHFSRVLTARWLGLPAPAGVGFALDAGGLTVLGDERGRPRLDHVNLVALNG
ncbi:histidine phosphatase family protein [Pseudonocardia acaciae]|uniref:histidine phosphatase family protein n=1 Tax=Pseudonocardia acaciae TaxID=551276 RepID=UPI00055D281A|nr:histidine phosphatase family protein [Pseudonocardia acaciae]